VLVVLTCVLVLLSALAVWLRALVLDTNAYVRAVGPVLERPDVRDALADQIVNELYGHVDVVAALQKALPSSADQFAPTLAASIKSTSVQLAAAALATKQVQHVWRDANRLAHDQIVHVLEGRDNFVSTTNGEIAIDTGALAGEVRDALDGAGIHLFDSVPVSELNQRFVLFRSTDLQHAQVATRILDDVGTWLPVVTVIFGAAAIALAHRRRRCVEQLAIGVALAMVLIVVGLAIGRAQYLDAAANVVERPIAEAPFDALVRPLRTGVRMIFGLAVIAWLVAFLGASRAVRAQEEHARTVFVDAIRRYARPLAWAGGGLAAVVLVAWDRPRPATVALVLGGLALWEVIVYAVSHPRHAPVAP
jgi:hypothetical protein